jgi:hypothetical protein
MQNGVGTCTQIGRNLTENVLAVFLEAPTPKSIGTPTICRMTAVEGPSRACCAGWGNPLGKSLRISSVTSTQWVDPVAASRMFVGRYRGLSTQVPAVKASSLPASAQAERPVASRTQAAVEMGAVWPQV